MKFAARDEQGRIVGLFTWPHPHLSATEEVPDDTQLDPVDEPQEKPVTIADLEARIAKLEGK